MAFSIGRMAIFGVCLLALPFAAFAQVAVDPGDYTGSRSSSNPSQITAIGAYVNGEFSLDWEITDSGGTFNYLYTVDGNGGNGLFVFIDNDFGEIFDGSTPISFQSSQAPVWGNFSAYGGGVNGIGFAYSTGISGGTPSGTFDGWIPVPNQGVGTPEPQTWLIMGAFLGLALYAKERKKSLTP